MRLAILPTKIQERLFVLLGVTMVGAMTYIACRPFNPPVLNHWYTHYPAHLLAFAALGVVWTLGLPRVSPVVLALSLVALSFAHEALEIVGHVHSFELRDAWVNTFGVLTGVICTRAALKLRFRRKSKPTSSAVTAP